MVCSIWKSIQSTGKTFDFNSLSLQVTVWRATSPLLQMLWAHSEDGLLCGKCINVQPLLHWRNSAFLCLSWHCHPLRIMWSCGDAAAELEQERGQRLCTKWTHTKLMDNHTLRWIIPSLIPVSEQCTWRAVVSVITKLKKDIFHHSLITPYADGHYNLVALTLHKHAYVISYF